MNGSHNLEFKRFLVWHHHDDIYLGGPLLKFCRLSDLTVDQDMAYSNWGSFAGREVSLVNAKRGVDNAKKTDWWFPLFCDKSFMYTKHKLHQVDQCWPDVREWAAPRWEKLEYPAWRFRPLYMYTYQDPLPNPKSTILSKRYDFWSWPNYTCACVSRFFHISKAPVFLQQVGLYMRFLCLTISDFRYDQGASRLMRDIGLSSVCVCVCACPDSVRACAHIIYHISIS